MYASPEAQFIVTGTTDTDTTDIIIDRSLRPSAGGARLRYYSILSATPFCSVVYRAVYDHLGIKLNYLQPLPAPVLANGVQRANLTTAQKLALVANEGRTE